MNTTSQSDVEQSESRRAMRALESLDRWADRLKGHQIQKRSSPRKNLRTSSLIYPPNGEGVVRPTDDSNSFLVRIRNISNNGVSFLYTRNIKLTSFVLCLETGKGPIWLNAEIIRSRQVHEGFWEFGARLTGRATM
ncbi:MAG: PilZ domain-containing protein [Planctomycetota bacterium]|nr:PilZ domain-containing protein [Planctomycetota bacterium]MDA1211144.1 PilZ domain-containing protein [Planctomycetota bacterium]